jgi:hypothetical protein
MINSIPYIIAVVKFMVALLYTKLATSWNLESVLPLQFNLLCFTKGVCEVPNSVFSAGLAPYENI